MLCTNDVRRKSDKPIVGPVFERSTADLPDHSQGVKEEAQDTSRPRVVSVTPTNDAPAVNAFTELHVRFDRPMDPLSLKLDFESGGFWECEFPKYNPKKYEFTIPVIWLREGFSRSCSISRGG